MVGGIDLGCELVLCLGVFFMGDYFDFVRRILCVMDWFVIIWLRMCVRIRVKCE